MNHQKLKELVQKGVPLAPHTVLALIEQAQRSQVAISPLPKNSKTAPAADPEHPESSHYGHQPGQWHWACCACPDTINDPNCSYCTGES